VWGWFWDSYKDEESQNKRNQKAALKKSQKE
jgi:hypothetical protein